MKKLIAAAIAVGALVSVAGTGPAPAEELCIGPACIGDRHRDRDRDEGREERRERQEGREERRERREDRDRMWR
jgi:hypothetical protein